MTWMAKLALQAPVPVFVAQGDDAPAETARLCLNSTLTIVETPRAAAILLVAGTIPASLVQHLHRLHDQLPHPRATVFWQAGPSDLLSEAVTVGKDDNLVSVLTDTRNSLLYGSRGTEADLLPDAPPNEWRGVGSHGQGGKGMMGGTPYGRPMAMTAADFRDGLELDAYTADFGPFLPMFPSGLVLTLTLQGDVIQKVAVVHPPFAGEGNAGAALLRLLGLPALAKRLLRGPSDDADFKRLIRLSGVRTAIPPGLGCAPNGSDVRERFERLTTDPGNPSKVHVDGVGLGDLLIGLEWHEAMLVLNSFDNESLRAICANTSSPEPEEKNGDSMDHEGHAGHMS